MKVRAILWTVTMGYTGFLLTGHGLRTFDSLSITEGFLGALTGLLLAIMFTLRERRRQRPVLVAHSIAEILPHWDDAQVDRPPVSVIVSFLLFGVILCAALYVVVFYLN
jgi:hypothetical protein